MLLTSQHSGLLIIDVQTRLLPAMSQADALLDNACWLGKLAATLSIPTLISEHCATKIGATDERLKLAAPHAAIVQKQDFSVWSAGCLNQTSWNGANQIVIAGIETHICVLQTAIDLQEHGYQTFIVAEATDSRHAADKQHALTRMRDAGCQIVTREMVAFEWLHSAQNPLFRQVHREFIR